MSSDLSSLEKRVKALEDSAGGIPKIKEKAPRKETEYNKFMKKFIADEKAKGSTESHKDLFSKGAKAWTDAKSTK
jgi:hypothetical protein